MKTWIKDRFNPKWTMKLGGRYGLELTVTAAAEGYRIWLGKEYLSELSPTLEEAQQKAIEVAKEELTQALNDVSNISQSIVAPVPEDGCIKAGPEDIDDNPRTYTHAIQQ